MRCSNRFFSTQIEKAGIQGIIFPSVVKDGDDNLIVDLTNCDHGALQIQNEHEFIEEAKKRVSEAKIVIDPPEITIQPTS